MEAPVPEELTVTQQNQRMVEYEVARIYDFFLRALAALKSSCNKLRSFFLTSSPSFQVDMLYFAFDF